MKKQYTHSRVSRRANRAQLCDWFEITNHILDDWLEAGMPVVQLGSRGVPWVFDLREVAAWYYGNSETDARRIPEPIDEPADEATIDWLGGDPDSWHPKLRRDWYAGEKERINLLVRKQELVEFAEHQKFITQLTSAFVRFLDGLIDAVDRVETLDDKVASALSAIVDKQRLVFVNLTKKKFDL